MEVEDVPAQQQPCKFPRIGNGGRGSSNSSLLVSSHNPDEESEDRGRQQKRAAPAGGGGGGIEAGGGGGNRLNGWHHSRIIRVSRASGGKDRHSKVWTSKGLRDRRVRLSVTTAIQFYDLQDRLGYDQPSKAVEWLIKAAQEAISELPSLNASFPDTPKQLSDERRQSDDRRFDSVELDADGDPNYHHQHVNHGKNNSAISKSGCSSTSETSKGSGLSLSRSDVRVNRVKARERARDRAAKEKEKESNNNANNDESSRIAHAMSQNASFTELLTGGIGGGGNSPNGHHHQNPNGEPINLFHKAAAAAAAAAQQPMDYFGSGLLGLSSTSGTRNHHLSGFHSLPQTMFSLSGDHHHHHPETMQHLSYVPDYIPVTAANGGEYNLNFSISSSSSSGGLAGFNRGTLQSNITTTTSSSPSLLPHLQRFSSLDGSSNVNVPFFTMETTHAHHHHQHLQFPAGLQLYGDGTRHSDTKQGKPKN